MADLEDVTVELTRQRDTAPASGRRVVETAVHAATGSLAHVSPGKAVVVRAVWRGAQNATVMVQGADRRTVARAQEQGRQAGVEEAKKHAQRQTH